MTVSKAVAKTDALRPNDFSLADKIAWLSELDGRIKHEILDTHEGFDDVSFEGYTPSNTSVELLVPNEYADIYIYWLFLKMDFVNGEAQRFNNSAAMHNTAWINFANHINRTHMPKSVGSVSGYR